MTQLIGVLLMVEGVWFGFGAVQRLQLSTAAGDGVSLSMDAARILVGIAQFAVGLALSQHRAFNTRINLAVVAIGTALWTLEVGAGLSPGNIFIAWRWPVVYAYWAYAAAVSLTLSLLARRDRA